MGMTYAAAVDHARRVAETLLVDVGVVELRTKTDGPYGPTDVWTTVYTGPMLVQRERAQANVTVVTAGTARSEVGYVVKLPASLVVAGPCRVTVTTSHDPALVGKQFTVTDQTAGNSLAVLRRMTAELITLKE